MEPFGMHRAFVAHGGGGLGNLWMVGWLFTIGFMNLSFKQGVFAIVIWPYYIGKHFHKSHSA
jgi:hypothetical protein